MIYLDYAATTPVDPQVLSAMQPYFSEVFANPSSLHRSGQKARKALEEARVKVADAIGAKAKEIIFTSGATEAINQTLRSVGQDNPDGHIITSKLEHKAVLASCEFLEAQGMQVSYLSPNEQGEITIESLRDAMQENTCLVALMHTNNETGAKTDISAMSVFLKDKPILFFCDAVQTFGYEALDVKALGVDFLSLSAHKLYGPKGVGALYIREGLELNPLMLGGEQERGFRAGTHNLSSIVGFGEAASLVKKRLALEAKSLKELRDAFEVKVKQIKGVTVNAEQALRGPKHSNIQVQDVDGEVLLLNLDMLGVAVSAGSACAAGSLEPSHVLTAMGLSYEDAKASIRFSFGKDITTEMMQETVIKLQQAIERCRAVV